ncbi:nitroreductase family deazaflavin-dependent oxidoreductase [Actinomadura barringtoniae]|uniref:Nitroreductase family deazaflavin-dependent oxidoreductase n=1 Tax=Actinomadura barringtoniae TaxID=1427535 RepID=A0A939TFI9_9ACTN|nr:nitroreductase/quinone reductase family protein [Actinomadura barringtoniae]MBO2454420.1 nitroreductase family deazaflavin-dependent oxidoreductase [Actinomadura barringtoniae]
MADWNLQIIEEFRANEGKVGGPFEGATLLLLTTRGRRSGRPHTTPLTYLADGGRLLVFASNAGGPNDPAWLLNATADPRVTVEVGTESYEATGHVLEGEERDRLYALQSELVPAYAEYQRQTERVIPVVALYRIQPDAIAAGDHLLAVHGELRAELAALKKEAIGVAKGEDVERRLRAHCFSVCDALGEHHASEDRVFPHVQKRYPGLAPVLDRLRREHVAVAKLKDDIRALVDEADPERFQAELERMTAELEAHFAYEERELLVAANTLRPRDLGR